MDQPEWIARAIPTETVSLDIGFLVSKGFYQPQVKMYGDYVLSEAIDSSAAELIRYYQDVLRVIAVHQKKIEEQSHCFWMRPVIFSPGVFAVAFPWYDTLQEATSFLTALTSNDSGMVFDDQDQGWLLEVYAESDRLYLRDSDPDYDEERYVIAVDRTNIARQASDALRRGRRIVKELVAVIGKDYWSRHLYPGL